MFYAVSWYIPDCLFLYHVDYLICWYIIVWEDSDIHFRWMFNVMTSYIIGRFILILICKYIMVCENSNASFVFFISRQVLFMHLYLLYCILWFVKIAVCSLFFQWKLVLAAILPVVSLESDLKLYALLFVINGSAFLWLMK